MNDIPGVLHATRVALDAAARLHEALRMQLLRGLRAGGDDAAAWNAQQSAAHGFAWFEVYRRALQEIVAWALRLRAQGRLTALEELLLEVAASEYVAQLATGVPMNQAEVFRPATIASDAAERFGCEPAVQSLIARSGRSDPKAQLVKHLLENQTGNRYGDPAFEEPTLYEIREQFARYVDGKREEVQRWHLNDELIPQATLDELGELGVFGLTSTAEHGGSGLGKIAMCVVTEELSRGYIGLGSIGTRAEIAAELIAGSGTAAQREALLPGIAGGHVLPAAAFTEPDVGSDLARVRLRAERRGHVYRLTGSKTWMTHGARSDLLTLLARTDGREDGYRGLSILLVRKPRGTDVDPFPVRGMRGTEIPVLGYRDMKEYEVAFDGVEVPADALLGDAEGQGFKQLMRTFETARIQTAARAVGVAQSAVELTLTYGSERRQFGRQLTYFGRVADKLALMAAEIMVARQLTLHAARAKDSGRRCDVEAGMAKLLAARVAWTCADNAVQIHGGNGFALEYPISRVLCDARVLNIFEGAAEIQAEVIAKALLNGGGTPRP